MSEATRKTIRDILLVEDDFFISDMYRTKLLEHGYEVRLAADGEAALDEMRRNKPDLLLLDIMLPKMTGLEVLREIKQNADWKTVPVILLTNLSEREYIEESRALGASDYIVKSQMTPSDVIGKVDAVLGQ